MSGEPYLDLERARRDAAFARSERRPPRARGATRRFEGGDHRVRRAGQRPRAGRTTSRPPSGSRSSTTTARCGARSRCRSSSGSSSTRLAEMADADESLRTSSPGRRRTSATTPGSARPIAKHYDGRRRRHQGADRRASSGRSPARASRSTRRRRAVPARRQRTPRSGAASTSAAYEPMVELLRYLEANGFTNYIASGGDRDFMRPVTEEMYGDPRRAGDRQLERAAAGSTTSTAAWSAIRPRRSSSTTVRSSRCGSGAGSGRRPILAGGNSNGDIPMLRYAGGTGRPALRLLVRPRRRRARVRVHGGAERPSSRPRRTGGRW